MSDQLPVYHMPTKVNERPNQPVYDPSDGTVKEATFDQAQALAKEGVVVGQDAYNEQLKNSWESKVGAAASGTANFAGIWNALLAAESKLGRTDATRQLRTEKQVNEAHPGYHALGEALPLLAPFLGLGKLGVAGATAAGGIGGAFDVGALGLKGATAAEGSGLVARGLAAASRGAANTANAAANGLPLFTLKAEADAIADTEAGHKEFDAQKQRDEIVKSPVTWELVAATGFHAAVDTAIANSVMHGAVSGLKGIGAASKGGLGLLEKYGLMAREMHAAPPDLNAGPRYTSYTSTEHAPHGAPTVYDAAEPGSGALPGGVVGGGPKQLAAEAGPSAVEPLANTWKGDTNLGEGEILDDIARPTPRPDHLQAMVKDHGVIGLPGDVAASHEIAPGIPRAGIEIPNAELPPAEDAEFVANPKLQRAFDEARAKASDAEKMQAERLAAEPIPKRDVGLPPEAPVAPEFDPAEVEPIFEFGAKYSQKHQLEALRLMTLDRLAKAHPLAREHYELNKLLTKKIDLLEKDRTAVDWSAQYTEAIQKKMANKEKLKQMVPRTYDPLTKEYAPSFADLNDKYREVKRGVVSANPKITFGAKQDPEALAAHTENMKQWVKENADYTKAAKKAEDEYAKAVKKADDLNASESKRIETAATNAKGALKKVEDRIADQKATFEKKVVRDRQYAIDSHAKALKKIADKEATALKNATDQASRKAIREAASHEVEIARLQQRQFQAQIEDVLKNERTQLEARHALESSRAKTLEDEAKAAEKAKTKAAAEDKKAKKEADADAKAQKKAQDAAKPRWEQKVTRESNDEFGKKIETVHTKYENGEYRTKKTIRIKAPPEPPKLVAGDWIEPFSDKFITTATVGAGLFGGPIVAGSVGAGLKVANKFVKYGLNNPGLHKAFSAAMGALETSIGPTAARLYSQSSQRGRRHSNSIPVKLASYHNTVKGVGYASQNPELVHSAIDAQIPNLAHVHPELANGVKGIITNGVQALNDAAPKKPYEPTLQDSDYTPPRAMQVSWLRKYQILGNPREALASGDPMAIKIVSEVYPNLYREYASQLTNYVQQHKRPMYSRQARLISQFLGASVRPIDDPGALQRLQQTGGPEMAPDAGQKPIGKSNSPTRAASQRASLDSPDASLDALGG